MSTDELSMGLLLDAERYILDTFTAASTPVLIAGLIDRYKCHLIQTQADFNRCCDEVDVLFSLEPRFAAPVVRWRRSWLARKPRALSYVLCSDAHIEQWRENYFLKNNIDFMLSLYDAPFAKHFARIPTGRRVHFPWTVPDNWFSQQPIQYRGQDKLCLFGAMRGDAYNVRRQCAEHPFVETFRYSGVENKALSSKGYMDWLAGFDAAIAAGSDMDKYGLTTPKYYEIAAAGALLFAQATPDLETLGFEDGVNCVVFNKRDFEEKAQAYLRNPEAYLPIRKAGRELVWERHRLSVRLEQFDRHVRDHLGSRDDTNL